MGAAARLGGLHSSGGLALNGTASGAVHLPGRRVLPGGDQENPMKHTASPRITAVLGRSEEPEKEQDGPSGSNDESEPIRRRPRVDGTASGHSHRPPYPGGADSIFR